MTEFIQSLYGDFCLSRVAAKRSVNSKGDRRGKITEALITNFELDEKSLGMDNRSAISRASAASRFVFSA